MGTALMITATALGSGVWAQTPECYLEQIIDAVTDSDDGEPSPFANGMDKRRQEAQTMTKETERPRQGNSTAPLEELRQSM